MRNGGVGREQVMTRSGCKAVVAALHDYDWRRQALVAAATEQEATFPFIYKILAAGNPAHIHYVICGKALRND